MDWILGIHGLLDLPATVISEWLSWWMDHGVDWMETCDNAEHQTASSISNIIVPSDFCRV